MIRNKIVSFLGSTGSGKTLLTNMTARELSRRGESVIIVCLDSFVPVIPYILSGEEKEAISLGSLVTNPNLIQNDILRSLSSSPDENIALTGYLYGDYSARFPNLSSREIDIFFSLIAPLADYILVDGVSDISSSILGRRAIHFSTAVVNVISSDSKGKSYYESYKNYMPAIIGVRKEFSVSSAISGLHDSSIAGEFITGEFLRLPFSTELHAAYHQKELYDIQATKESLPFFKETKKLTNLLFGGEEKEKKLSKKELEDRDRIFEAEEEEKKEGILDKLKGIRLPWKNNKGEF